MVIRTLSLAILMPFLTACAEHYAEPIKMPPHGTAVRANLAAQIINPIPPGPTLPTVDAARTALAVEAYRTGEVKDPTEEAGKSTTSDVD